MRGDDLHILDAVLAWHGLGHAFRLATVIRTWGASPRPPGAWMAWREDGAIVGSVSGGCVEDELLARWRHGELPAERPCCAAFGGPADGHLRLPCGAVLEILVEPPPDAFGIEHLRRLREAIAGGRRVRRAVDIHSGAADWCAVDADASHGAACALVDGRLLTLHGPAWRIFIVGANDIARHLAEFAPRLDFLPTVCDVREEYRASWNEALAPLVAAMPDDALLDWRPDAHSAVVAVAHDPKLDDLALIDALASPAFYVAAVGSLATSAARRQRLALFDLDAAAVGRLHAPAGIAIGSRTPAEIALSILAELVAARSSAVAAGLGAIPGEAVGTPTAVATDDAPPAPTVSVRHGGCAPG